MLFLLFSGLGGSIHGHDDHRTVDLYPPAPTAEKRSGPASPRFGMSSRVRPTRADGSSYTNLVVSHRSWTRSTPEPNQVTTSVCGTRVAEGERRRPLGGWVRRRFRLWRASRGTYAAGVRLDTTRQRLSWTAARITDSATPVFFQSRISSAFGGRVTFTLRT